MVVEGGPKALDLGQTSWYPASCVDFVKPQSKGPEQAHRTNDMVGPSNGLRRLPRRWRSHEERGSGGEGYLRFT